MMIVTGTRFGTSYANEVMTEIFPEENPHPQGGYRPLPSREPGIGGGLTFNSHQRNSLVYDLRPEIQEIPLNSSLIILAKLRPNRTFSDSARHIILANDEFQLYLDNQGRLEMVWGDIGQGETELTLSDAFTLNTEKAIAVRVRRTGMNTFEIKGHSTGQASIAAVTRTPNATIPMVFSLGSLHDFLNANNRAGFGGRIRDLAMYFEPDPINDTEFEALVHDASRLTDRDNLYGRIRRINYTQDGRGVGTPYTRLLSNLNIATGNYTQEFAFPTQNAVNHSALTMEIRVEAVTGVDIDDLELRVRIGSNEYLYGAFPTTGVISISASHFDNNQLRFRIRNTGANALTGFQIIVQGYDNALNGVQSPPLDVIAPTNGNQALGLGTAHPFIGNRSIALGDLDAIEIIGVTGQVWTKLMIKDPEHFVNVGNTGGPNGEPRERGDIIIKGWDADSSVVDIGRVNGFGIGSTSIAYSVFRFTRTSTEQAGTISGLYVVAANTSYPRGLYRIRLYPKDGITL